MFKPEGVYPAMLTPFDEQGNVNESELIKMVNWLITENVSGLFPLGSSGEFIHLDFEQKIDLIRIVRDQAKGKVPVTPGATDSCADNCIKLINEIKNMGCEAVVIAPPYYLPLTQEQIEEHYKRIVNAFPDYPIVLYNIPIFNKPIDYNVVSNLSKFPSVVGMKDSSGSLVDFMHFIDKVRLEPGDLNIMTGREEMLYSALTVGGKGSMSATVGVVPELMTNIYKLWCEGETKKALEVQFSLLQLIRTMFSLPFPLGFKAALEVRGFKMGNPKHQLDKNGQTDYDNTKAKISNILSQLKIDTLVTD